MKDKRYILTLDLYIYQEDDVRALNEARSIVSDLKSKDDNRASIVSLVEQEPGTIGNRKVDLK